MATAYAKKHPYGTTFMAKDNEGNRKSFPNGPFGTIDVAPSVCTDNQECPFYHYKEDSLQQGGATETPIHLLIASYRDRLCPRTLHNAFHHAKSTKRLFIRIIEQKQADSDLIDDAGCWTRYCKDYNTDCQEFEQQVRTVHVDAAKAKGPTDPRSKLSAMIAWDYVHRDDPDEIDLRRVELQDFCMQTDSHMDFSDNWDTGLIEMHHRTENDYAVLSTYVTDIEKNNQDERIVPNLCMVMFTSSIRNWGTKLCSNLVKPKLTNAMWGAGLSFHRCHAEINVPVDPYMDGVFDGEEGSRGLRFFTHGYDVYSPDIVLVTHDYHGHQSNPVVHTWGGHGGKQKGPGAGGVQFEEKWKWTLDIDRARSNVQTLGTPRVNLLLGIGIGKNTPTQVSNEIKLIRNGRYGLGTKRTLEQASAFSGINLQEKKMVENKCGNLQWVPFVESPEYGVNEVLSRGLAGEVVVSRMLAAPVVVAPLPVAIGRKEFSKAGIMDIRMVGAFFLCLLVIARITSRKYYQKKGDKKN
jgi:hypothetical protein